MEDQHKAAQAREERRFWFWRCAGGAVRSASRRDRLVSEEMG